MPTTARRLVDAGLARLRLRGRPAAARALRLTGAAVAAFVVALVLFPGTTPILAPLTALLVVEITLKDSLTSGLQRIVSVGAGVLLAVLFSSVVGLTWWSLGVLVAVSILVGQLLRLGPHMLEVPISGMLVLAVGGAQAAALDRIAETLIGVAVGLAVNLAFPPGIGDESAARAVHRFAGRLARLLRTASAELAEPIGEQQALRWMDDARRLSRNVPEIDQALRQAAAGRRLNARALVEPDTGGSLRAELDALEHTTVTVRSMFRSILDGVRDRPTVDPARGEDLRLVFAALLADVAASIEAFGELARHEGTADVEHTERALAVALERLREARDRADDLRMMDTGADGAQNGWELSEPVREAVERVLRDLDVLGQARRPRPARPNPLAESLQIIRHAGHLLHPPRTGRRPADPRDRRPLPADQTGPHRLPLGRPAGHRAGRPIRDDSPLDTGRMRAVSRPGGRASSGPGGRG
ncbi:aromatic acid exporter family protein [Nakamurella sp.]|uniref:FUSC family protein n=1 Tax=Nakamurella sp. TaxID=1869182 RepID=UPI003B3A7E00